jgi:hypothetical protein
MNASGFEWVVLNESNGTGWLATDRRQSQAYTYVSTRTAVCYALLAWLVVPRDVLSLFVFQFWRLAERKN